jgi:hypothetical protein
MRHPMLCLTGGSVRVWRWLLCAALAVVACHHAPPAPRVLLEPAVDLRAFGRVAIVEFAPSGPGGAAVARLVTRRFIESVQGGQPGVRILELGAQDRVLAAIGHRELDFEAIQAIGKKYGADAVFAGQLELSEVKPRLSLSQALESLGVKANVEAKLFARLVESEGGATLWSHSCQDSAQVAAVNLSRQGASGASARDPDEAYGHLARGLAQRVSYDLGPRYAD